MSRALALITSMAIISTAACSDTGESPVGPDMSRSRNHPRREPVVVCHRVGRFSLPLRIGEGALEAHLAHGDYVTQLYVDPGQSMPSDGVRYEAITAALDAARAVRVGRDEKEHAACRITIDVAAGTYTGSFDPGAAASMERFPLLVDMPDITLHGAFRMEVDRQGRATGENRSAGSGTILTPDRPIDFLPLTEALILVADNPAGFRGNGAIIDGFDFRSGHDAGTDGGLGILSLRVTGLVVRGNRFERGLTSATDLRATSALVAFNYGEGLGLNCGLCLVGPGRYIAIGNRLIDGGLGGIYAGAAVAHLPFSLGANDGAQVEPYTLPSSASADAVILNNEIRGHGRLPVGFAVRILALGPSSAAVPQSTKVFLGGNSFTGNTFGVILDAGFPQGTALRKGDLDVTLRHNTISGSCQANLLVAFTRHTGALGVTSNPYLQNSNFRVSLGGDLAWSDAWYSNPDGNGNTLVVDGDAVAPGQRVAYDPTKVCS